CEANHFFLPGKCKRCCRGLDRVDGVEAIICPHDDALVPGKDTPNIGLIAHEQAGIQDGLSFRWLVAGLSRTAPGADGQSNQEQWPAREVVHRSSPLSKGSDGGPVIERTLGNRRRPDLQTCGTERASLDDRMRTDKCPDGGPRPWRPAEKLSRT